jgi:hypothetical protein
VQVLPGLCQHAPHPSAAARTTKRACVSSMPAATVVWRAHVLKCTGRSPTKLRYKRKLPPAFLLHLLTACSCN